jgi:Membrane carboxypeptidase (penicillin-binding protein)
MSGKFKPTTTVVDSPICIGNWCPHNYSGGYSGSMSLTSALTHSVNTIAVKLSIAIGDGNPKAGRAKIVQLAKAMGIRAPLPDTPRCRSAPTKSPSSTMSVLMPPSPMAAWR